MRRATGSKPGKPIPAGLVSRDVAAVIAIISGGAGLALGWMSGPTVLLLGILVMAIGYGYDLVFKGTAWSWLPFAVGIPLLPVYGWVGAAGTVPSSFVVLIPAAVLAGTALAVANARADEARDRRAGTASVATALGDPWSWRLNAVLLGGVVLAAAVTLIAGESAPAALAAAAGATGVVAVGLGLGQSTDPGRRERAWEIQAVGVALLATAWLAGVPLTG